MPRRTLWLVWSALALAHTGAAADGIIEGVVDDSVTGGPVYRATATLFGANGDKAVTSTDSDGVFWFRAAAPGRYEIAVEQFGYVPRMVHEGVELEAGGVTRLTVRIDPLEPVGSVAGSVLDSDRKPVADAFIVLRRKESRSRISFWQAVSGRDGTFRIGNVPAGCYRAVVAHHGEVRRGFRIADDQTYRVETHTLCVAPGQEHRLDVHLRPVPSSFVRGRAEDGVERSWYSVRILPRGVVEFPDLPPEWTEFSAEPDFSIRGLPAGRYSLLASNSRGAAVHTVDTRNGPVDGIVLRFSSGEVVEGVVRTDGHAPPPRTRVMLHLSDEAERWRMPLQAQVGSNGAFRFDQVPPGLWKVEVEGIPAGAFVVSVKLGGREEDDGLIEIGAGSKAKLEIETASASSAVEGAVTGGDEDPVALVNAYPVSGPSIRIRTAPVRLGRFLMAPLPPGKYRLMAFPIDDLVKASAPDAWRRHSLRLPVIEVERGMLISQDVPLIEQ